MSEASVTILSAALRLPDQERASVAAALMDSLDQSGSGDFSDEWDDEIQRRIAEIDSGQVSLIPWSQARTTIMEAPHGSSRD